MLSNPNEPQLSFFIGCLTVLERLGECTNLLKYPNYHQITKLFKKNVFLTCFSGLWFSVPSRLETLLIACSLVWKHFLMDHPHSCGPRAFILLTDCTLCKWQTTTIFWRACTLLPGLPQHWTLLKAPFITFSTFSLLNKLLIYHCQCYWILSKDMSPVCLHQIQSCLTNVKSKTAYLKHHLRQY